MEMDLPTRAIVDYVGGIDYAAIPDKGIHAIVRNYVDTVSCVAAGLDLKSARATRRFASGVMGTPAASVFALETPSLLDAAVLANSAAVSFGEFHDDELTRP